MWSGSHRLDADEASIQTLECPIRENQYAASIPSFPSLRLLLELDGTKASHVSFMGPYIFIFLW